MRETGHKCVINHHFYLFQLMCFCLSFLSTFTCTIAAAFTAIHGGFIAHYNHCKLVNTTCYCTLSQGTSGRQQLYEDITSCELLQSNVKFYLFFQSFMNCLGGLVSFWLVLLLWKSRYHGFHARLDTYTYTPNEPPHV